MLWHHLGTLCILTLQPGKFAPAPQPSVHRLPKHIWLSQQSSPPDLASSPIGRRLEGALKEWGRSPRKDSITCRLDIKGWLFGSTVLLKCSYVIQVNWHWPVSTWECWTNDVLLKKDMHVISSWIRMSMSPEFPTDTCWLCLRCSLLLESLMAFFFLLELRNINGDISSHHLILVFICTFSNVPVKWASAASNSGTLSVITSNALIIEKLTLIINVCDR